MSRVVAMPEKLVLFVCVENACRSLMAEAMFNSSPPPGWRAESAGTLPARAPNPRTERMLDEIGLSLPDHPPRQLTPELDRAARVWISMGCLDDLACPVHWSKHPSEDWGLPDPGPLDDDGFRRVRDELRARVGRLVRRLEADERFEGSKG